MQKMFWLLIWIVRKEGNKRWKLDLIQYLNNDKDRKEVVINKIIKVNLHVWIIISLENPEETFNYLY